MQHTEYGEPFPAWDDDGNEYELRPRYTVTVLTQRGNPLPPRRDLDGFEVIAPDLKHGCLAGHVTKGAAGEYRIIPGCDREGTILRSDDPASV